MADTDVSALLSEVAATQGSSIGSVPVSINENAVTVQQRQEYGKVIASLQEEISALETAIKDRQAAKLTADQVTLVMDHLVQGGDIAYRQTGASVKDTHDAETEALADEVAALSRLTGIHYHEATQRLQPDSSNADGEPIRVFNFAGHCRGVPFAIELHSRDSQVKVEWIDVKVPVEFQPTLQPLIDIVLKEKSPQLFFTQLGSYAAARQLRADLFEHFCAVYPKFVTAPLGPLLSDALIIKSDEQFQLTLSWKLGFEGGQFKHSVLMFPTATLDYIRADKENTVCNQVSTQFDNLVETKGLTAAVDIMIRAACKS